jgi:hypothetical protein
MRKLSTAVIAVLLFAATVWAQSQQTQTITWTDAASVTGGAGACLLISMENGQSVPGQNYYCPEQPSYYAEPYCYNPSIGACYGSLYLPDQQPIETITTTWGTPFNVTKDGKGRVTGYTRTDSLVVNDGGSMATSWTGSVTQSFSVSYGAYNGRCRCFPMITTVLAGGSGTLTSQGN